jgi:hypothetical protein
MLSEIGCDTALFGKALPLQEGRSSLLGITALNSFIINLLPRKFNYGEGIDLGWRDQVLTRQT